MAKEVAEVAIGFFISAGIAINDDAIATAFRSRCTGSRRITTGT
jgi:hypothetical protein